MKDETGQLRQRPTPSALLSRQLLADMIALIPR